MVKKSPPQSGDFFSKVQDKSKVMGVEPPMLQVALPPPSAQDCRAHSTQPLAVRAERAFKMIFLRSKKIMLGT